ncbi:MAG: hypothetical protein FIA92_16390 [Chloroflexi bacterium]|nr:hypothetical protein [Chloroflexota bacterium]
MRRYARRACIGRIVMTVAIERRLANLRLGRSTATGVPTRSLGRATTIGAERLAEAVHGERVRTPRGCFVRVEAPSTVLPLDRQRLARLPGQPPPAAPLVCLDTETTGLATAAGTLAFLVGLGWWERGRFRQEQLLLPDHADEPALLAELAARIPTGAWLVTYNGRGFDWPLLVARYRMAGSGPPAHAGHLDLLPLVRRMFRHRLGDARLATVETGLLGLRRGPDVPGWEIPGRYLEFLRDGEPWRLVDVVRHNDEDVRSLARLLIHVDRGYAEPARWPEAPVGDLAGLARTFAREARLDEALACLDAALDRATEPLPDQATAPVAGGMWPPGRVRHLGHGVDPDDEPWWSPRRPADFGGRPRRPTYAAWPAVEAPRLDAPWTEGRLVAERARLLRRLGRHAEAEAAWLRLAGGHGVLAAVAWIEVAKLREHRLGDREGAITATIAGLRVLERQAWLGRPLPRLESALAHRLARLRARVSRPRTASRSGPPRIPGTSTAREAAAAAKRSSRASRAPPPETRDGTSRHASMAARNTSPAPV